MLHHLRDLSLAYCMDTSSEVDEQRFFALEPSWVGGGDMEGGDRARIGRFSDSHAAIPNAACWIGVADCWPPDLSVADPRLDNTVGHQTDDRCADIGELSKGGGRWLKRQTKGGASDAEKAMGPGVWYTGVGALGVAVGIAQG